MVAKIPLYASLLTMLSGDFDKIVQIWKSGLTMDVNRPPYFHVVRIVVEDVIYRWV